MAQITDSRIVDRYADRFRRTNDLSIALYRTYKQLMAEVQTLGLGALFQTNEDVIDKSGDSGANPITSFDVNTLLARATDYIADWEANDSTKLKQALAIEGTGTNPLF